LTELRTYFVLGVFPAIIIFVLDWGGPGLRWVRLNKSPIFPPEIRTIEERRGLYLLLIKYALVLLALLGFAGLEQWHLVLAPHSRPWLVLFLAGILGGSLVFGFRRVLALLWPPIVLSESNDNLLRGPTTLWLTIFVSGAITEEPWRALCISGFQHNGYSSLLANALPAFAFSIAHVSGTPSRIGAGLEIHGAEIIVGLMFGALFIWSGSIASPCLASLIFYTLNLFWLRQHYLPESSTPRPT
jgi:hypothetical protein